jgi:hypothetical protein
VAAPSVGAERRGDLHDVAADQADAGAEATDELDHEVGLEAVGLGRAGGVGEAIVGAVDVVGEVDREAAGLDVGDELVEGRGRVGAALGGPELADVEAWSPSARGGSGGAGADLDQAALAADQIVGVIRPGREADRDAEALGSRSVWASGWTIAMAGSPCWRVRARAIAATAGQAVE